MPQITLNRVERDNLTSSESWDANISLLLVQNDPEFPYMWNYDRDITFVLSSDDVKSIKASDLSLFHGTLREKLQALCDSVD